MTDPCRGANGGGGAIAGLRILLVEDEMMLSMLVEDWLTDEGAVVVGPAASLARAMALARTETLDAAVLDVNIGGEPVWAAAAILAERGIPFVFTTGYSSDDTNGRLRGRIALQKPFRLPELTGALVAARATVRRAPAWEVRPDTDEQGGVMSPPLVPARQRPG